jgi:putative two-component system response regulator
MGVNDMEKEKYSILVIDDDPANCLTLTNILKPEYKVFVINKGVNAVKAALLNTPDLILLDLYMPDMSGFEVLSALKQKPETKNIPVILVSGLISEEDLLKGLRLEVDGYITKPLYPETVRETIAEVLQK